MKQRRIEDYGNMVQRLYARDTAAENCVCCRNITFQVTSGCNLRCSYCYEHHKSVERMSIETGRKVVDYILDLYEKNESDFVNQNTRAVVLDFIGGEPLLEAELIEHICDYWFAECYRREIPLAPFTRISFATNGKLWFSPAAQHLFAKYHEMMSVTVSIDGVQELHDKYRVDEHGIGSFSLAWKAFQAGKKDFGWLTSKMTFVPGSFQYIADSIKMMLDEGCVEIACNYAYEPVYTPEDGRTLYEQMQMTSGAGLPPMPWTSANDAITLARKITAYDALWTDCDQQYVLAQWRLRHWTLSNSGKLEGCTSYNYQYTPAVAETGVKRVLATKAQGANFLVGSAVCMGERGENTSTDRNLSYNHDIFNWAKISSITNVTVNDTEYVALNLELDAPIDTTTTMLVSTMPWESGTTEVVPGHSDGCRGNLTNGKYPYRVAGIEMQIGAYVEQLDPLWKASLVDDDHWHYDAFSCKSGEKQVGSISSDYAQTGSFDLNDKATWSWHYIRKLGKLGAEAMMYEKFNGSGSTYVRAAFASPGSAGVYAPWRGGNLDDGANCGLPCANGNNGPGTANWNGVPRHADDKIALKRA